MRPASLAFFPTLFLLLAALAHAQPGSLAGLLAGNDGRPLAATVIANGVPPLRASARALSSASGAFSLSGLPPGLYHLCAEVSSLGYLDPCAWDPILPTLRIAPGQALAGHRLTVRKGATLQVRVNDAAGLLKAEAGAAPTARLMLGVVTSRGLYQSLAAASKDTAGSQHQGAVPRDSAFSLHVGGAGLSIRNAASGAAVAPGSLLRIAPSPGAGPGPITLVVSPPPKP